MPLALSSFTDLPRCSSKGAFYYSPKFNLGGLVYILNYGLGREIGIDKFPPFFPYTYPRNKPIEHGQFQHRRR
jgi:hypothetical protein